MNILYSLRGLRRIRARDERVVLIPNQWNGSVQQYYHFLLGYLAPIFQWTSTHPTKRIAVRDCGPMNRWFDLLPESCEVEIMTVGDVLHILAGDLQTHKILKGMDFPSRFSSSDIANFASVTRKVAEQRGRDLTSTPLTIVTDRASFDEFFATPAAEWPESGSQKRSVPNLSEIVSSWADSTVQLLDGAQSDIYEQILLHSHARILIGQHGAGLTNMIWMPRGSWVIEILPPMPADASPIFQNLTRVCGLHHFVVHQDEVHSRINPETLTNAYRSAVDALKFGNSTGEN